VRGAVFLLDEATADIGVEAAVGIPAEGLRARYKVGEGVVGRVVQSGRPVVIPATAREPLVMNRAFQRRSGASESSLVCVPSCSTQAGGRHRVDFPFNANRDYQSDAQFLSWWRRWWPSCCARSAPSRPSGPAAGRERPPPAGVGAALRLLEHRRDQRSDAPGLQQIAQVGPDQYHRDDPGRIGHRQGADRARAPLQLASSGKPFVR